MNKIFTLLCPINGVYTTISAGLPADILKYIDEAKVSGYIPYEYTVYTWEDGDMSVSYVTDSIEDVESYLQQFLPIPC